jgi:hypothetical protein
VKSLYESFLSYAQGETVMFSLGQAGYLFRTKVGCLIAVDPYLSDCCDRLFGFKRLMPMLLDPAETVFDLIVVSHSHNDHYDRDAMPTLLRHGRTRLICATDCREQVEENGIDPTKVTYMKLGDELETLGVTIRPVPCDHGALFIFGFGNLADGADYKFNIFYGAADNERNALLLLGAVGPELYDLGQSNSGGVRQPGMPTYIFAFNGVGGSIVVPPGVPEPATWAMMLLGFGGLGAALRQRRRQAVLA